MRFSSSSIYFDIIGIRSDEKKLMLAKKQCLVVLPFKFWPVSVQLSVFWVRRCIVTTIVDDLILHLFFRPLFPLFFFPVGKLAEANPHSFFCCFLLGGWQRHSPHCVCFFGGWGGVGFACSDGGWHTSSSCTFLFLSRKLAEAKFSLHTLGPVDHNIICSVRTVFLHSFPVFVFPPRIFPPPALSILAPFPLKDKTQV